MKKLLFVAFVAFCNPFVVNCEKTTQFHFIRTEKMNDTDELFKYDLKSVEKVDSAIFNVNCDADLFVPLDDEWHMWIKVYHNAEGKEEFGEKPFLSMPKKAFCEFMKTTYKDRLYSHIKDYSNFPDPDECPIKADHYVIKDYPFDASKYSALARPGMWRIDLFVSQDHEDSHITKIGISIFTSVTQEEA